MSQQHLQKLLSDALAATAAAEMREQMMSEELALAQQQLLQYLDDEAVLDEEHVTDLEQVCRSMQQSGGLCSPSPDKQTLHAIIDLDDEITQLHQTLEARNAEIDTLRKSKPAAEPDATSEASEVAGLRVELQQALAEQEHFKQQLRALMEIYGHDDPELLWQCRARAGVAPAQMANMSCEAAGELQKLKSALDVNEAALEEGRLRSVELQTRCNELLGGSSQQADAVVPAEQKAATERQAAEKAATEQKACGSTHTPSNASEPLRCHRDCNSEARRSEAQQLRARTNSLLSRASQRRHLRVLVAREGLEVLFYPCFLQGQVRRVACLAYRYNRRDPSAPARIHQR